MVFGYTHEQLANITKALNNIDIKGRQNCQLIETIFVILENGINVDVLDEQDIVEDKINKDGGDK